MLETFDSADALTDAAALGIESCLAEALRSGGEATLVATGGRSPGAVYDRLAVAGLDWARVTVTLSDERCVGSPPVARITLTLSALCQSRAIFLLIAGEAKRQVLARAVAGEDLPVGRLISQANAPIRVLWAPAFGG